MEKKYTKTGEPCIPYIRDGVAASSMTNKSILGLNNMERTRDESGNLTATSFDVSFEGSLSAGDITILDSIVDDSIGKHPHHKTAFSITSDIFNNADAARQGRLLLALRTYSDFDRAIENRNFPLARSIIGQALTATAITQEDYDYIIGYVPESKYE
jgi:hypothetical protein